MKIVVAPDSFKGSLSATKVSSAIKEGIIHVFPDAEVITLPLADGGEGTMENLVYATDGEVREVEVHDPLHRRVKAKFGVLGDQETAVIEFAQASGLTLLTAEELDPIHASSYGTGELIRAALDQGFRKFIIGLGGSATNDAGTGLLRALGMKFYDHSGSLLTQNMLSFQQLAYYDDSSFDPRIKESSFLVACDVTNPLCGTNGATAIFGPQKGVNPNMIAQLDLALEALAQVVKKQSGIDLNHVQGAGAAGGAGAAFNAFFKAEMKSGIDLIMEAIRFQDYVQHADYLITGEGKMDKQTLSGKVVAGVSRVASAYGVPVFALCGVKEISAKELEQLQVSACFSIIPKPCDLEEALNHASEWITDCTVQIMNMLKYGNRELIR